MTSSEFPASAIEGASVWYGPEMARRQNEWIYRFTDAELKELEHGLDQFRQSGASLSALNRDNFPLPDMGRMLSRQLAELQHGRGFVLFRGLSVLDRPIEDIIALNLGITSWFGTPRPQNARGDLVGHVRDLGGDPADPTVRIYQTNRRQTYHTDSADLVSLLCVQKGKEGGLSSIVSSHTIFNEILHRRPDLVPALFSPYPTDRRGDIPEGKQAYFPMPIFHWHAGYLSAIYSRTYILSSQRLSESPRLSSDQLEALELVHSLAEEPELHLNMDFEPGDIQLLHNHQVLHDRTEFKDWPEPERRRHLLRIWLCPPDGRPLPDVYAERYGSTDIGNRGGIFVPDNDIAVRLS